MAMNFEKLALASVLQGTATVDKYKLSEFQSRNGKFIYKLISKYIEHYGKLPDLAVLESTIRTQISSDSAEIYIGYLKGLPKDSTADISAIRTGLQDNKAINALDDKIAELVELSQDREIGSAKKLLEELLITLTDTETKAESASDIVFDTEKISSVPFCLDDVDLNAQGLTLISAKSGGGKSILALQQAIHSYKQGRDVLFLNLELSQTEMLSRAISCAFGIPIADVYTELSPEDVVKFGKLKDKLFSLPNKYKMINKGMRADDIISTIRAEAKTGLDLVVIDYLQLVDHSGYSEQWQFLTAFAKELHQLSLELGITILSPIQVNEVTFKNDSIQITSRGSRELEFSSSLWVHLHQDELETKDGICRCFTIKARHAERKTYVLETKFNIMAFGSTGLVM